MSHRKDGALPYQDILGLVDAGCILDTVEGNIQPSSIDLSVSNEIYRMPGIIQPLAGEGVRELIERLGGVEYDLALQLEVDIAYLVRLNEKVDLPDGVYGYCNPKSTTGRLDVHARVVADNVARYDTLSPKGYSGELWVSVVTHSFSVKFPEGTTLTQLRLFTSDTRLDELELELALRQHQLLWSRDGVAFSHDDLKLSDKDGSIILTVDLSSEVVGWECMSPSIVLDMSRRDYDPRDFFRKIELVNGYLMLKKDRFYILSTEEFVRVPPGMACEMRPMDDRSGDFRAHYAGFIDPGWGWGKDGEEKGRPLTLEVRPHENMILGRGQPIAKIRFERMRETPDVVYDAGAANYSIQDGPKLAKHFKT